MTASARPSIPFVPCLTPGCGATPLNMTPAGARAFIEYYLRDDPAFQYKVVCKRCGRESRYSLPAVIGMIPVEARPRALPEDYVWAMLLMPAGDGGIPGRRAFLGERVLIRRLRNSEEAGEAELLSEATFAPALAIGDVVTYARWGQSVVCAKVRRGGVYVDIPMSPTGGGRNIGIWVADPLSADNLRAANLFCSNASCGTVFGSTREDFRHAQGQAEARRGQYQAAEAIVCLTCDACGTSRVIDDRTFDGLPQL